MSFSVLGQVKARVQGWKFPSVKLLAKCSIWRIISVNIRLASHLAASCDNPIVLGLCNCNVLIQYISISLLEEDNMLHMQLDW